MGQEPCYDPKTVGKDAESTRTVSHVGGVVGGRRSGRLRVVSGADPAVYELRQPVCVIGRDRSADFRLMVAGVSRHHAKLVMDAAQSVQIIDLAAKNGTFVNGAPVKAASLEPGDHIQVGKALLRFERAQEARVVLGLSEREAEVAHLVARGLTNAEIAGVLGIARTTVATHLQRAYTRLGLSSRAELASYITAHEG